MDVAVKGLFWLLEAARSSSTLERFVLLGGDAAIGHATYRWDGPITEDAAFRPYPGSYALSKVLEEVMVEQYGIQYGLDWCILRAPWIFEKDDLVASLSFGDDVFGGPRWRDLAGAEAADRALAAGAVPRALDVDGRPLRRSIVHVDDVVSAVVAGLHSPAASRERFHVAMDQPFDYGVMADHLSRTTGRPWLDVATDLHSVTLDNSKARTRLGWRPSHDTVSMVDAAFAYRRSPDDPRVVVYPG